MIKVSIYYDWCLTINKKDKKSRTGIPVTFVLLTCLYSGIYLLLVKSGYKRRKVRTEPNDRFHIHRLYRVPDIQKVVFFEEYPLHSNESVSLCNFPCFGDREESSNYVPLFCLGPVNNNKV